VALFVLILVGLVVAQTWLDWRDSNKGWVVPEWAKGMALGGVVAVSLAAATSFASVWMRSQAAQAATASETRFFFLEFGFLASMMGVIVFAARKKRLRLMLFVGCVLMAGFWLGTVLWR
jgi:hypothetical protein